AFPIGSHPARNVLAGGRVLVDLSTSRVEPPNLVRLPLGKPNPAVARDIDPVAARVLSGRDEVRDVIGDELLGLDVQSHDAVAGRRPHHLPIRVDLYAVAGDRAIEAGLCWKDGELLVLGVELQKAAIATDLAHPDRVARAPHRRTGVIQNTEFPWSRGPGNVGKREQFGSV